MKLGEILEYISDSTYIQVYVDDEIVAEYDGKNSIDPKYNELYIVCPGGIRCESEVIQIYCY